IAVLAKLAAQKKPTGPEIIQETFKQVAQPADFVPAWAKFLHDGFLAGSAAKPVALTLDAGAIDKLLAEKSPAAASDPDTYEVVFVGDSKLDDGRYENNGWAQELPDPITKQTWDNAAWISPATARKLGMKVDQGHVERDRIE